MPSEIEKISFGKKIKELDLISYAKSIKEYKEKVSDAIELKNKISIFVDTNVLLRYYSTSFSKRKGLYEFFKKHKNEIILTYQVQKEFVKNREDIIDRFFNETLKDLGSSYRESVINPIRKYYNDNKKLFDDLPSFSDKIEKLNSETNKLYDILDGEIKVLKENFASTKNNDNFLSLVQEMQLVNSLTEEDIKFLKSEFDTLKKNIDTNQMQNEGKKPQAAFPGLGDIRKKPLNPYGDYLLFHEMMLYIKESKKDAVFLTYDSTKNDWLKENKEPHSHYIQIIYLSTGQNLFMIDADRFFDTYLQEHFNSLVSKIDYYSPKSEYEKDYILDFVGLERIIRTISEFVVIDNYETAPLRKLIDEFVNRKYIDKGFRREFQTLTHFRNIFLHERNRSVIDSISDDQLLILLQRLRAAISKLSDLYSAL